ncbi:MAG TPA: GTP cyclohydrolase II [Methylibium sp.]|nr:GTP cyclohydrolase II [Methylibium sp.]
MQLLRQHDAAGSAGHGPVPDPAAQARAAVRADRARTELRHGRAIVLLEPGGAEPALLLAAIETLDAARWAALQARADGWRLLLSRERLHAIGWELGAAPQLLALAGAMTLETLQAFAAVAADDMVDGQRLFAPRPGGAALRAALQLAAAARLAPALVVAELGAEALAALERDDILCVAPRDVLAAAPPRVPALRRLSEAPVPLAAREDCRLIVFGEADGDAEHVAVLVGRPDPSRPVPVRLHSSCLTGDLLGSLRCDCGDQLRLALDQLAVTGGVLLYLAQEGRGIGLVNKLRAYRLQDCGLDTFEADRHLGFTGEQRDFGVAAAMLQALGHGRVQLHTNNPHKVDALRRAGIEVIARLPLPAPSQPHNRRYLEAKRRAGHHA